MFTGLIEDVGTLIDRRRQGDAGKLTIQTALPVPDIGDGESIAVNGACLTVESRDNTAGTLVFYTLAETLDRTNLGSVPTGGRVNLERAMQLNARLGGHLVSGHVDATAPIRGIREQGGDIVLAVALSDHLKPLVIPKGSIAIDGISLTIAALHDDHFTVHIIPHTWKHTNLAEAETGDHVNLEADMIGKYVLRQQAYNEHTQPITMQDLQNAGFLG